MHPKATGRRSATTIALLLFSLALVASAASADPINLAWNANPASENVTGYMLSVGTSPGVYTQTIDVGNVTSFIYPNAVAGQKYYFTLAAYMAGGVSGPKAPEISGWSDAPPTLTNPGNQSSVLGAAIIPLQLQGIDPLGDPVSYTATGLPPGLTLQGSTGLITGIATTAGSFNVTVTVRDNSVPPLSDSKSFTWTVGTAVVISVTLSPDPAPVTAPLTATVANGPANATDWIGIYAETAADATFADWCYLNGSKTAPAAGLPNATVTCFAAPAAGRYQVRFFSNGGFTKIGTSNTITVSGMPALSIADTTKAEGNSGTSNAVFTVTLSAASTSTVTVDYVTADGTGNNHSDFNAVSGTLTFAPGTTSMTIPVQVIGDTAVEGNETFTMTLSNATNATIADAVGTATIVDDDSAPLPTLSIADVSKAEGNSGSSNAVFTVTLSAASASSVTVQYATANGTATAGSDYTTTSGTLTFAAGTTSQTISVPVIGDTTVESNETFTVTLSTPTNATILDGLATGTITNDDAAPLPTLSITDVSKAEGNSGSSNAVFTVTLSAASASSVTVQYATANGTATAGSDYTTTSGTLTFAAGTTSQTISVPVIGDTTVESNETFTVTLSTPTNATILDGLATGTITNDDAAPLPTLSITDVSRAEGNSGSSNAVFTVTLSAASASSVTVQYATANGTATAGSDYTTTSGTLTFAAGTTSQTISVPVIGDTTVEADETFTVTLSTPTNATILDGLATGTITNDDAAPLPTLSITDVSRAEGNSGSSNAVFTVTLSAASASSVTVQYATANGTATAGSDYTTTSGTLTFAAGTTSQTISVPVIGDTTVEADETFTVTLSTPTNATILDGLATGTITNDDAAPLPTLSITDVSKAEGNSGSSNAVFTVTLSAASASSVTVQYATANGTATAGSDYTTTSGTLTFAAGTISQTISVPVIGDTTVESNETFTVTLSTPTNATILDGLATGTITNDDAASLPTLSIADVSKAEGNSGSSNAVFTVTLSAASVSTVTVVYNTASGTATVGSDYAVTSGTLTFAAGTTSQTIAVPVTGDTTVEPDETFTVTLSAPTNATILDGVATGTITNDDSAPLPTLSIADVTKVEGNSGTSNAVFTVTLSAASASTVTVVYNTASGTATAGSDYAATSGTLTFAAGTTSQTLAVPVTGDTTVEPDETFTVTLSAPTNATILDGVATGTITNDDSAPLPTLSIADVTKVEGNSGTSNAVFTVTLSAASASTVTVVYNTASGTATAGSDYAATSGTLTFAAGTTSMTLAVPVTGDTTVESNETFTVTLSNPTNATILDGQATGTITNDDSAPLPTLSIADVTKVEGNSGTSNAVFTVTLSAASTSTVTVDYVTADVTANNHSDFNAVFDTLSFAPGTTSMTIATPIIGDTVVEPDETFTMTLSNPTNATIARAVATATITNDDTTQLPTTSATLTPDPAVSGAALSVVVSDASPTTTDWLGFYVEGAADTTFLDWCYLNSTKTAPATAMANATVSCLTAPANGGRYQVRLFTNNTFTKIAISNTINVQSPPTISIANVTKVEGNSGSSNAVLTVTLSAASASSVTVQYATSDRTATAGSDYTSASGTLTFTAGATSRTISVPVTGDTTFEPDETFAVVLSNPTNATLATTEGLATITNDDVSAGPVMTMSPDPATTGSTPSTVVAGGPANATDWIGFYAAGAPDNTFVAWCYLNGTKTAPANGMANATVACFTPDTPGQYQARLFSNNTFTKVVTSNTITVQDASSPPPPPPGTNVTLTPNPATVGATLSAAFTGGPGTVLDWMGLYPEGAADNNYVGWCFTNSTKTAPASGIVNGTVTCFTPTMPGRYQVRFFASNTYNKVATSNTITVPGTAIALTPDPGVAGAPLSAVVYSGPANAMDWIALFAEGAPDSTFLDWCYLNSTKTAPASGLATATVTCFTPPVPGRYQLRLFSNNTFNKVATSNTITVP